jgi:hypothetical protein
MNEDIFDGLGVEITLNDQENFLKIVETLTRIGVLSRDNTLIQTCHILHKRGRYAIFHFKELFKLDGVSKSEISEEDISRRNGIVNLLNEWNLCESPQLEGSLKKIKIIPFKEKSNYVLKQNYTIGDKKSS